MKDNDVRIIVRCPLCDWRILDKVTPATGVIEMKCPKCGHVVSVDLSLRKTNCIKYRIVTIR